MAGVMAFIVFFRQPFLSRAPKPVLKWLWGKRGVVLAHLDAYYSPRFGASLQQSFESDEKKLLQANFLLCADFSYACLVGTVWRVLRVLN